MKTTLPTLKHLKRWECPSCYFGAQWPDWFVFLGQSRDSDALERANFDAGLAAVRAVMSSNPVPPAQTEAPNVFGTPTDTATVQVVRESHWAVGWVEWIAIHESDVAALQEADRILSALEDYPVADENLWSEYESEEADQVWRDCYGPNERLSYIREHRSQFEFRNLSDLIGCVRGKYFSGYASELLS